ncbi:MAG: hypothetical protein Q6365_011115 [Candidatus Sigynarchaeota archaeon]
MADGRWLLADEKEHRGSIMLWLAGWRDSAACGGRSISLLENVEGMFSPVSSFMTPVRRASSELVQEREYLVADVMEIPLMTRNIFRTTRPAAHFPSHSQKRLPILVF